MGIITELGCGRRLLECSNESVMLDTPGLLKWESIDTLPKTCIPLFGQVLNRHLYCDLFNVLTTVITTSFIEYDGGLYLRYDNSDINFDFKVYTLLTLEIDSPLSKILDTSIPYYVKVISTESGQNLFSISWELYSDPVSFSLNSINPKDNIVKCRFYISPFILPGDCQNTFQLLDARDHFFKPSNSDEFDLIEIGSKIYKVPKLAYNKRLTMDLCITF